MKETAVPIELETWWAQELICVLRKIEKISDFWKK
jgi:hypothetical protein